VLGLDIRTENPLHGLVAMLRDRRMLLLLDNCEHVIDAAADLAAAILSGAQGHKHFGDQPGAAWGSGRTRIPASRRSASHKRRPGPTAAEAAAFPAVQLFVERVTAIVEDFALTDANAPAIAEICRRLDGLPLAIEFAAPRVEVLGIDGRAARLDDSLQLLGTRRRTTVPRHRTMRAVVDWSYGLLGEGRAEISPEPWHLCWRLHGRGGGCGGSGCSKEPQQWDRSPGRSGGEIAGCRRLQRYPTVVSAARHDPPRIPWKAAGPWRVDAAARRHAAFYRNYLEGLEESWSSLAQSEDRVVHGRQVDNIRAAIEWAFSPSGDGALGVALTVAAVPFLMHFGLIDECAVVTRRVLTGDRASHARIAAPGNEAPRRAGDGAAAPQSSPEMMAAWKSAYEIAAELDDPEYRSTHAVGSVDQSLHLW